MAEEALLSADGRIIHDVSAVPGSKRDFVGAFGLLHSFSAIEGMFLCLHGILSHVNSEVMHRHLATLVGRRAPWTILGTRQQGHRTTKPIVDPPVQEPTPTSVNGGDHDTSAPQRHLVTPLPPATIAGCGCVSAGNNTLTAEGQLWLQDVPCPIAWFEFFVAIVARLQGSDAEILRALKEQFPAAWVAVGRVVRLDETRFLRPPVPTKAQSSSSSNPVTGSASQGGTVIPIALELVIDMASFQEHYGGASALINYVNFVRSSLNPLDQPDRHMYFFTLDAKKQRILIQALKESGSEGRLLWMSAPDTPLLDEVGLPVPFVFRGPMVAHIETGIGLFCNTLTIALPTCEVLISTPTREQPKASDPPAALLTSGQPGWSPSTRSTPSPSTGGTSAGSGGTPRRTASSGHRTTSLVFRHDEEKASPIQPPLTGPALSTPAPDLDALSQAPSSLATESRSCSDSSPSTDGLAPNSENPVSSNIGYVPPHANTYLELRILRFVWTSALARPVAWALGLHDLFASVRESTRIRFVTWSSLVHCACSREPPRTPTVTPPTIHEGPRNGVRELHQAVWMCEMSARATRIVTASVRLAWRKVVHSDAIPAVIRLLGDLAGAVACDLAPHARSTLPIGATPPVEVVVSLGIPTEC